MENFKKIIIILGLLGMSISFLVLVICYYTVAFLVVDIISWILFFIYFYCTIGDLKADFKRKRQRQNEIQTQKKVKWNYVKTVRR